MGRISLVGYDKLGVEGTEGIRYAWNLENKKFILESAAFVNKTKGMQEGVSGYTTSVSLGCILRQMGYPCKFCRTGNLLPFVSMLTASDIAKQNIFMVLSDMYCSDHVKLKQNKREFAYMGQGEPGYSYSQVRLAIKITDYVMKKLEQDVYRHIIATSGVTDVLYNIKTDLQANYYDSRITTHYSLHATKNRSDIMPINKLYSYEHAMKVLKDISVISEEKICLGMLLLKNFKGNNSKTVYSTSIDEIEHIFKFIDPEHFRFSFCEYNSSEDIGVADEFPETEAHQIYNYARMKGYESKLFTSFGKNENTACGMLAGKIPEYNISKKWRELEVYADELIGEAIEKM